MPYISTEQVKLVRNALKKEFPKVKFSITRENYSTICVSILESSIDFDISPRDYKRVNEYRIDEDYTGNEQAKNILNRVYEIINITHEQKELVYDGDYGSVPNYYIDINIGKWNRPYVLKLAA